MLKNTKDQMRRVRGLLTKLEVACIDSCARQGGWENGAKWRGKLEDLVEGELERLGRKAGEE